MGRWQARRATWIGLAFLSVSVPTAVASAGAAACEIAPSQTVQVASLIDAVTYELVDGSVLRLEGIAAPRPPAELGPDANWPIRERARAYAAAIMRGQSLQISPTDAPDRYGRLIAQAYLSDGRWLNGALVAGGMARVETRADQTRCVADALALEATSRDDGRGLWELSAYAVRSPEESAGFTNDFQIVEGVVLDVADVRGRIFLNFGEDWRTDFTVTIAPGDVRYFEEGGLASLEGRRIRVRGWLEFYNGPMIEADHPAQIEVLEPQL